MITSLKVLGFDQNTTGMNFFGEKFFLNLEKKHGNQNQIHNIWQKKKDGDVEIFKKSKVSMKHFSQI